MELGKTCKPVIVVHGGAGTWNPVPSQPALESVKEAAKTGFNTLRVGGTAVDAVVDAVALMEDTGAFNAGCGSALNIEKRVEMEAAVMNGETLQAGAAGLLSDVRNPVRLARVIMEKTDRFRCGQRRRRISSNIQFRKAKTSHGSPD